MKTPLLTIENLTATIDNKTIIHDLNLTIFPGEVHVIMGPNGSGKSTLAAILAGKQDATITKGIIKYEGQDLLSLSPEERSRQGIFLGFQYPVEIPGISTFHFLKTALNEHRKARKQKPLDASEFLEEAKDAQQLFDLPENMLKRSLNEGFSGGEKKKNEMFQMAVLKPRLAILDETDSGLDVDSLRTIGKGINTLRTPNNACILITHYQRLLQYITPDKVHIMKNGTIIKSGDASLAHHVDDHGYHNDSQ